MDGKEEEEEDSRPASINTKTAYQYEITTESRPQWTTLDVIGNKKGQLQDYPETGLKYAYGGDAGN